MKNHKRLIVNADDLGRTAGINQGIFDAHRRGVVTSEVLTDRRVRDAIERAGVQLIHFGQL